MVLSINVTAGSKVVGVKTCMYKLFTVYLRFRIHILYSFNGEYHGNND